MTSARRCLLVAAAIVWLGRAAHASSLEVIEPGPEAPGAVTAAASEVAKAVKLGKDPKSKWEALFAFSEISRRWPAALHDCYYALANLRVGYVSRAHSVWEVSALRGTPRPAWCTGDFAKQLAKAMTAGKFVEITIDVTPRDAIVSFNGEIAVRNLPSVWWSCAYCGDPGSPMSFQVAAEAPGYVTDAHGTVTLTPTGAHVAIVLQRERPPDAGVTK